VTGALDAPHRIGARLDEFDELYQSLGEAPPREGEA
jgi:hypothetical protein